MTNKQNTLKRAQKVFNLITDSTYDVTDRSVILLAKAFEREYRRGYSKGTKDAPLKIKLNMDAK